MASAWGGGFSFPSEALSTRQKLQLYTYIQALKQGPDAYASGVEGIETEEAGDTCVPRLRARRRFMESRPDAAAVPSVAGDSAGILMRR